jgi:hypothetical protein
MKRLVSLLFTLVIATGSSFEAQSGFAQTERQPAKPTAEKNVVIFNVKSYKYHAPRCSAARRCTVNCIPLSRAEAKSRGGIPCGICGGGEP